MKCMVVLPQQVSLRRVISCLVLSKPKCHKCNIQVMRYMYVIGYMSRYIYKIKSRP